MVPIAEKIKNGAHPMPLKPAGRDTNVRMPGINRPIRTAVLPRRSNQSLALSMSLLLSVNHRPWLPIHVRSRCSPMRLPITYHTVAPPSEPRLPSAITPPSVRSPVPVT